MNVINPISGNKGTLTALRCCKHEAVILAGLVKAISFLDNEGREPNALTCLIEIAAQRAEDLANALEGVEA